MYVSDSLAHPAKRKSHITLPEIVKLLQIPATNPTCKLEISSFMTPNKGIDTPNTLSRQMESLKTRKFLSPSDYLSYKKITQLNDFSLINKFLSFV